jgi:hypothetical protein
LDFRNVALKQLLASTMPNTHEVQAQTRGLTRPMNIVTIKWGRRYPAGYVNILRRQSRLHGLGDARFICFTDDSSGLDADVEARPLPQIELPENQRWTFWRKLALFDPGLGLTGPCLYLDLDIVLIGDLRPLVADWSGRPRFIETWVGPKTIRSGHYERINSSVMVYDGQGCGRVLTQFHADQEGAFARYSTDQGFIYEALANEAEFFPRHLCVSFKKHCLARFPLNLVLQPRPPGGACVVCFHGKPDPHEAKRGYREGRPKYRCRPTPWIPDYSQP